MAAWAAYKTKQTCLVKFANLYAFVLRAEIARYTNVYNTALKNPAS